MLSSMRATIAMASNPVVFGRKSAVLFRSVGSQVRTSLLKADTTRFQEPKSVKNSGSRRCSSCTVQSSRGKDLFGELGWSVNSLRQLGFDCFRVACTGGGSGGSGGYGGSGSGGSGGSGGGGDGGGKWSFLSWYLALLEKHPVLTKALTSAILTFFGDLICQVMIDQVPSVDVKRISLFTFLGMVLVGPTLHFWYFYLSKLVKTPGASGAFLRLLLDQFLFAPAFIGVFLSTLVTLEGRPSQVMQKLQQEWLSSVIANWQLWIPFQFLNFRFVPQQFQVLAANIIALVWNVILSYKAHKEIAK